MPRFSFVGDSPRVFPEIMLEVAPGDVVDLDENPDPHFFEAVEADAPVAPEENS